MRMIVPVTDKDPKRQLGELIQRARVAREFSHRDLAVQCGTDPTRVKDWESGIHVPRGHEWARLKGMLYTLRPASHVWQAALRVAEGAATADSEARIDQQESQQEAPVPVNDIEPPEPPPLQDPRTQTSFGAALRIARLNIGFTQDELGQFLDVTGTSISAWETETNTPVLDNYNRLVDALPELRDCVPPGVQNIQKPGRPSGPSFPRAPTNPGGPQFPRASTNSGPQFPRAVTQQPPLQLPPPSAAGRDTDMIAQAGIAYAYALKEEQQAKERHATLLKQIAASEAAVKTAKDKAADTLKQLMNAVGVA